MQEEQPTPPSTSWCEGMADTFQTQWLDIGTPEAPLRMAYIDTGGEGKPVLVCAHGIGRNKGDFYRLAEALAPHFRIVACDMPGHGESDHLPDSRKGEYGHPFYGSSMVAALASLEVQACYWLGTSYGGVLGMIVEMMQPGMVQGMIFNDIGPEIERAGLSRIGAAMGNTPREFDSLEALQAFYKGVIENYDVRDRSLLMHLLCHAALRTPEGRYKLRNDPYLASNLGFDNGAGGGAPANPELWDSPLWEPFKHKPLMVMHGGKSDILSLATAQRMVGENATDTASLASFPNAGHTPNLLDAANIEVVRHWLQVATARAGGRAL